MGQDRFFLPYVSALRCVLLATVAIGRHHTSGEGQGIELVNVSYDPTREFYQDFNPAFAKYWASKRGSTASADVARRFG